MTIIEKAEDFVFYLFKDKLSPSYTYHNFNHALRVVNNAKELCDSENLDIDSRTAVLLAAWFHDTGYVNGSENHEESSILIVQDFLKENHVSPVITEQVIQLIRATKIDTVPEDILERIMCDADSSHFADENYMGICELLREEWKLILNKTYTDKEWAIENRTTFIRCHRFYTHYAKENWQINKEKNLTLLQEKIHTVEEKKRKKQDKFEKTERPERGIDTMFRVTLNNHTRLSNIADSKANILLSVNAIIVSISLSTLIPKLDSPSNAHLIVPTFIMLILSATSIIFAILSTRPKVTQGSFTRQEILDKKVNLLFFGNFYKMPLKEYEWAMNEMMANREHLYNTMIKDLYYLGIVLNRKYKLLRITYSIFMINIIASVIAFVWAFKALG